MPWRPRHSEKTTTDLVRHFLPLLRPFWRPLSAAALAMALDAFLNVFRPWPLKVVIDRVLSDKPSRVPFLHGWLDNAPFSRMEILYGACAATLLIAVVTGFLLYYFTRALGDIGCADQRVRNALVNLWLLPFHSRSNQVQIAIVLSAGASVREIVVRENLEPYRGDDGQMADRLDLVSVLLRTFATEANGPIG